MKEKEIELTNILNTKIKELNLKNTTNEFSYYDATNQHYIIEYKIRSKHYNEQFIQVDKLYNLLMIAENQNKIPVYIVADPKGIFIYNLNKNKGYFLNSKIIIKQCPYRTEFKENKKISKYFYILTNEQLTIKL
jgi:hypothetical protein